MGTDIRVTGMSIRLETYTEQLIYQGIIVMKAWLMRFELNGLFIVIEG